MAWRYYHVTTSDGYYYYRPTEHVYDTLAEACLSASRSVPKPHQPRLKWGELDGIGLYVCTSQEEDDIYLFFGLREEKEFDLKSLYMHLAHSNKSVIDSIGMLIDELRKGIKTR